MLNINPTGTTESGILLVEDSIKNVAKSKTVYGGTTADVIERSANSVVELTNRNEAIKSELKGVVGRGKEAVTKRKNLRAELSANTEGIARGRNAITKAGENADGIINEIKTAGTKKDIFTKQGKDAADDVAKKGKGIIESVKGWSKGTKWAVGIAAGAAVLLGVAALAKPKEQPQQMLMPQGQFDRQV